MRGPVNGEELSDAGVGAGKGDVGGLDFGESGRVTSGGVGMPAAGSFAVAIEKGGGGREGVVGDTEDGKGVGHVAKLSPHEQWAEALGLVTLKPPFWRSSE